MHYRSAMARETATALREANEGWPAKLAALRAEVPAASPLGIDVQPLRKEWNQGGHPKRKVAHGVAICPWGCSEPFLSACIGCMGTLGTRPGS